MQTLEGTAWHIPDNELTWHFLSILSKLFLVGNGDVQILHPNPSTAVLCIPPSGQSTKTPPTTQLDGTSAASALASGQSLGAFRRCLCLLTGALQLSKRRSRILARAVLLCGGGSRWFSERGRLRCLGGVGVRVEPHTGWSRLPLPVPQFKCNAGFSEPGVSFSGSPLNRLMTRYPCVVSIELSCIVSAYCQTEVNDAAEVVAFHVDVTRMLQT